MNMHLITTLSSFYMVDINTERCAEWFSDHLNGDPELVEKYLSMEVSHHDPLLIEGIKHFSEMGWMYDDLTEVTTDKYMVVTIDDRSISGDYLDEDNYNTLITPDRVLWYPIVESEYTGNEVITFKQDFQFSDEQRALFCDKLKTFEIPKEFQMFGVNNENKTECIDWFIESFLDFYRSRNSRFLINIMKQFPDKNRFGNTVYKLTTVTTGRYGIISNVVSDAWNPTEMLITDASPEWVYF